MEPVKVVVQDKKPIYPDSIIIDWESCSLNPDSALLSFGALAFNRNSWESCHNITDKPDMMINVNVDLTTQFINGFHFDQETAKWWRTKNAQNIAGLYDNRLELKQVMQMLNELIERVKQNCRDIAFFCRHTHADYVWTKHLCEVLELQNPIRYNRIYDVSTYIFAKTGELKGYIELPGQDTKQFHHAFNDCYRDALQIITVNQPKV